MRRLDFSGLMNMLNETKTKRLNVPEPIINGKVINLHNYALNETYNLGKIIKNKTDKLKKDLNNA